MICLWVHLGGFIDKVKLKKVAERGIENGLYRVKALLGRNRFYSSLYHIGSIQTNSQRKGKIPLLCI